MVSDRQIAVVRAAMRTRAAPLADCGEHLNTPICWDHLDRFRELPWQGRFRRCQLQPARVAFFRISRSISGENRKDFRDLGRSAHVGRQDLAREATPLAVLIDSIVADSRCRHLYRAGPAIVTFLGLALPSRMTFA
jgi:hypothetical protein